MKHQLAFGTLALLLVGAVFGGTWLLAGPISAILYTILFLAGVTMVPTVILLGAPSFPGSVRNAVGKLQWILGAVAYDVPFLVQHEAGWQLHVGRTTTSTDGVGTKGYEVYINGAWRPVEGGVTNMTVLGWRPFGILRYKTDGSLVGVRADTVAEQARDAVVGDGGTTTQSDRGGYAEAKPPGVGGNDGRWLVDLKRVFTSGVQQIGDIALLEKTEEVMTRKDAQEGAFAGWEPIIATGIGLAIGVATGYVMLGMG